MCFSHLINIILSLSIIHKVHSSFNHSHHIAYGTRFTLNKDAFELETPVAL